jgi:ribosomal protein S18 acetylase RimI-like enzyme
MDVRRASAQDLRAATDALARAFMDDPVACWSCPPERLRFGVLRGFHGTRMRQLLPHQEVWITDDRSAAALWAPPNRWRTTWREDLAIVRATARLRLALRQPLIGAGLLGMEREHPHDPPHWYLAVLGTDPVAQGQGFGSAVLRPVLEQCDRDGVGAFLESSKERNIDFYARHGFRVLRELRLPRGPKLWPMWRDPHR